METIRDLFNLPDMPEIPPMSTEDFMKWQVKWENERNGTLTGYHCETCRDKGYTAYLNEYNEIVMRPCACLKVRQNISYMEQSGMKELLQKYKFDNFYVNESWQEYARNEAIRFSDHPDSWLYVAGQPRSGKTHLCTAICGKLLASGRQVKYVLWRKLLHKLEQTRFKSDGEYFRVLDEIKETDVLYIDDFLKTSAPENIPKMMDFAFEIIDGRYNSSGITILTSELFISTIDQIDEATSGRIRQKSKFIQIEKKAGRNYGMKQ